MKWPTHDSGVKDFLQSCLVCLLYASGTKVPRPIGNQVHAENLNEILQFHFLYIDVSITDHKNILILKEDFSGYVFL